MESSSSSVGLVVLTHFAFGALFLFGLSLIVELLSFAKTEFDLHFGTPKVHRQGYGAKSLLFDLAMQLMDLLGV